MENTYTYYKWYGNHKFFVLSIIAKLIYIYILLIFSSSCENIIFFHLVLFSNSFCNLYIAIIIKLDISILYLYLQYTYLWSFVIARRREGGSYIS